MGAAGCVSSWRQLFIDLSRKEQTMDAKIYLVIQGKEPKYGPDKSKRREVGNVRVAKNRPHTASDEIALQLNLTIPDALYFKPQLVANVTVPDSAHVQPEIGCEVQDNIAEVIRNALGMDVQITVGSAAETREESSSD
jgi:hypothetical protein